MCIPRSNLDFRGECGASDALSKLSCKPPRLTLSAAVSMFNELTASIDCPKYNKTHSIKKARKEVLGLCSASRFRFFRRSMKVVEFGLI